MDEAHWDRRTKEALQKRNPVTGGRIAWFTALAATLDLLLLEPFLSLVFSVGQGRGLAFFINATFWPLLSWAVLVGMTGLLAAIQAKPKHRYAVVVVIFLALAGFLSTWSPHVTTAG